MLSQNSELITGTSAGCPALPACGRQGRQVGGEESRQYQRDCPYPVKLRLASTMIAVATQRVPITKMSPKILGGT
jgi:hypothetical protein